MTVLLLFVACGAAVAAGLVGAVAGWVGSTAEQRPSAGRLGRVRAWWDSGTTRDRTVRRAQVAASLAGGFGGWLVTGMALCVLLVPLVVFGLPWLFASTRPATTRIDTLEALAEWTQRLADVLLLGTGLEQAVATSRSTVPPLLETEVNDLMSRMRARWRPADALRAFGDDLDDAAADKIVAALLLRVDDRGPGLAGALSDLAESVREEVRQRRAIEADRAKHRATVRWLTLMIVGVGVVGSFNGRYAAPYGTPLGQAVLAFLVLAFVGIIAWMRNLAAHTPPPRLLERDRRSRTGATRRDEPSPNAAPGSAGADSAAPGSAGASGEGAETGPAAETTGRRAPGGGDPR